MRKQARLAIGIVALTVFMLLAAIPREPTLNKKICPK